MKRLLVPILFAGLFVSTILGTTTNSASSSVLWLQKIDPLVLKEAAGGDTEVLISLKEQANLSPAFQLGSKKDKGEFIYDTLREVALRSQQPILEYLQQRGIPHRSFWVSNMIWVKADYNTIAALAAREDIARIYPNPKIKFNPPPPVEQEFGILSTTGIEWSIEKINAPAVWAKGFTGQGVVIGGQDTGVDWDHPALKNQYRGWDGATADHNYNWHDAIDTNNSYCEGNSPEPCDDYGHGTHTIGTAVGDDDITHHIGVAPGAQWIACRNMDEGDGTPATYTECYEWFIAPYPIGGDPFTDGDPGKAPDIINNSWACIPDEGCDPESLRSVVKAVYAAGILTVHSAGNWGPACSTVRDPAAIYPESFTVGATDSTDLIASFSSRGPVTIDSSNLLKPNVSAPGVWIKSCVPGGGYMTDNGTSMAAPHVAGLAALLISADPTLSGQVNKIRQIIEQSADPQLTPEGCGGDTPTSHPNNTYGWGRIDAWEALQLIDHSFAIAKTAQPSIIAPGQLLTYTLTITHYHPTLSTSGVVVDDVLPTNVNFITATLPFTMNGNTISWNIGTLTSTESSTVQFIVRANPQASGEITNSDYSVKSDDVPTVFGESVVTTIVPFDIEIGKTAPSTVAPGKTIPYTLTVTNPHPSASLHNILISDTIPADTIFITGTLPNALTQDMILWNKDELEPGQTWSVTLTVSIPVTQTSGIISNSNYGVQSNEVPFKSGMPVQTVIQPLKITKISTPAIAVYQKPFTYTLTVTNNMLYSTTHNLILTDTLPLGTEFITSTQPFTLENEIVLWKKDYLYAGEIWKVDFSVIASTKLDIYNTNYGVKSAEVNPTTGKSVITPVHIPGLMLSPGVEANLSRGSEITYTHMLTNTGNFTDTFAISIDSSQGWVASNTIAPATIAPGKSKPFSLMIIVPLDASVGDIDITTIRACSQADSSVFEDISDTTKIQAILYFPLIFGSGMQ